MADNRFLAAVGVIVFLGTLAFPFVVETGVKDSAQDWIVLQAGWTGLDVSRPVDELVVRRSIDDIARKRSAWPMSQVGAAPVRGHQSRDAPLGTRRSVGPV
jgi:hypothetical protein